MRRRVSLRAASRRRTYHHEMEGIEMLVLSRKLGEKIHVGPDVVITVVDIDRGKIRLGIEAPRDVAILRAELLPQLADEERKNDEP